MNKGETIFSQIIGMFTLYDFTRSVEKFKTEYNPKHFSFYDHLITMIYAQLAHRESLRDIEESLTAVKHKLYHSGFRSIPKRSTLAEANEKRDWRIFEDFAKKILSYATILYRNTEIGLDIENSIYAFDSSTIDLCLKLFSWADFRTAKAGIKIHTLINIRGNIPKSIGITEAKVADVKSMDDLEYELNAIYIFDRGYFDFARLYKIELAKAFFIIRQKRKVKLKRLKSKLIEKLTGVRSDQIVRTKNKAYNKKLRRVSFYDEETKKKLYFITNNFDLKAEDIAKLYKMRWQVELFFKWMKQNLKIKHYYGNSENAVKIQIWTAVAVYAQILIIKHSFKIDLSPNSILQIASTILWSKTPIKTAFSENFKKNQEIKQDKLPDIFDILTGQ